MAASLAPCLPSDHAIHERARFVPKSVVMRVMAVWHGGDWIPLPGGFARVVAEHSIYRHALRPGGIGKDVWVLSEDETAADLAPTLSLAPARAGRQDVALRSRTADDLFWLGRYVERLDAGTRQFLAALRRLASGGLSARAHAELGRLAQALKTTGWIGAPVAAAPIDGAMFFAGLTDAAAGGTAMRICIDAIRRLMLGARDQMSTGMERALHHLTNAAMERFTGTRRDPDQLLEALDGMLATIAAFSGYVSDNMPRDAGWSFLDLGKRIERGVTIAQAIRGVMTGPIAQLDAGLRLSLELYDSTNAYLMRYQMEPHFARALHFVLADRENPRALLNQLERIERRLHLPAATRRAPIDAAVIPGLIAAVETFVATIVAADHSATEVSSLFDLLDRVAADLMALSDSITRAFFTHTATPQKMGFFSRSILLEIEG
jgi:uncharacterized alpha-E superfamily protein